MHLLTHAAQRGFALGAKHGVVGGFRAFFTEEATPEMDETAMQGAIGIIIAVGGVLIALYIIAVVVGSISYSVTSGNIRLSPTWNTTITNIDSQAQATFNLANGNKCLDVRTAKSHKKMKSLYVPRGCASDSDYRGWYPYDRYWCILRSRHLNGQEGVRSQFGLDTTTMLRPLNIAIA